MKLDVLRASMKDAGVDALIVYDELNQRYLSDFDFSDGFLLIKETDAYLITDFRYFEMAVNQADPSFTVLMPDDRQKFLDEKLKDCSSVGFEGNFVSFALYNRLCEKNPSLKFVDVGNMIEKLREVKTPEELAKIARSQEITDSAFAHLLGMITPNMTEVDVALELEYAMKKSGAQSFAFETIAVSGDGSALPHGKPRNVKLKSGFLTMDFGAKLDGYCSDMTRTIVIGKADADMKKLYNTVLTAQEEALKFIRAGVDCADTDKVARAIIEKDYPDTFGHSLGHSVGLYIHEEPRLSSRARGRLLRVGEVLTVEPGIYLYGKYGCRIEDMVAVTESGCTNFTHSAKELIEIY